MIALFFSSLFLFAFIYYYLKKKEFGLNVIIFSIPFSYSPFFTATFGEYFPISITGILVVLYYFFTRSWRNSYAPNSFYKFLRNILLFYIILGTGNALFYNKDAQFLQNYIGELTTQISQLKPFVQVLYNASNLLICIYFLNILNKHFQVKKNIIDAAYVFSITIIPIFIYQILQMTGYERIFGGLFVSGNLTKLDIPRYMSLFTIFGLGIYVTMVMLFSLHFKFKYYRLIFISAIFFSLFCGERQALVIPFLALGIFYLYSKDSILTKLFKIIGFFIGSYFLLFILKDEISSIKRLWVSIEMFQNNQVLEASGRDVQGIPYIIKALQNWPIMGKGLYNWGYFKGIDSYYADHVIWFNIYQKFGLIGFLIFIAAIIYFLIFLVNRIIISKNKEQLSVFLGLMISFIGMQFLDNFFWFTNTMLLYIFMFGLIFSSMNNASTHIINNEGFRKIYK
jgi:hypothetical protein